MKHGSKLLFISLIPLGLNGIIATACGPQGTVGLHTYLIRHNFRIIAYRPKILISLIKPSLEENYFHFLKEFLFLSSRIQAKENQRTREDDEDEQVRAKILTSSLQFVPAYGWTRAAVEAGTETLGTPGTHLNLAGFSR